MFPAPPSLFEGLHTILVDLIELHCKASRCTLTSPENSFGHPHAQPGSMVDTATSPAGIAICARAHPRRAHMWRCEVADEPVQRGVAQ